MATHTLLVDESHLLMRNLNVPNLKVLKDKEKRPIGGLYGVLSSINYCLKQDPTINKVYLLKDGYAKWRKDLFPGYKASRGNNPDSPKYKSYITPDPILGWSPKDTITWTRRKLTEISNSLGLHGFYDETSEADDLAYLVGKELLQNGEKITFMTSDRDWSQLIHIFKDYDVSIWDGMKREIINKDNFKEKYNVDPEWFIFQKAMEGDGSDDIPGVITGCGPKAIQYLIEMAQEKGLHPDSDSFMLDLYGLIDSLDESILGRYKKLKNLTNEECKKQLELNLKLVDFRQCPHKSTITSDILQESTKQIKLDFMSGSILLKELGFNSLSEIIVPGSPWYRLQ
jgi:5'-3' exonuclease